MNVHIYVGQWSPRSFVVTARHSRTLVVAKAVVWPFVVSHNIFTIGRDRRTSESCCVFGKKCRLR